MKGICMFEDIKKLKALPIKLTEAQVAKYLNIDTRTVKKYWNMEEKEYLKLLKEDIVYYENGKLNGKYAEIFKNNEVYEIGTYQNDVKNGNAYSYDKDTLNLIEEKNYDNDIR